MLKNRNTIIPLLLIGCLGVIFGYDYLLVSSDDGVSISVSEWIDRMSHLYPVIPFLVGVMCGHLFFGIQYVRPKIEVD